MLVKSLLQFRQPLNGMRYKYFVNSKFDQEPTRRLTKFIKNVYFFPDIRKQPLSIILGSWLHMLLAVLRTGTPCKCPTSGPEWSQQTPQRNALVSALAERTWACWGFTSAHGASLPHEQHDNNSNKMLTQELLRELNEILYIRPFAHSKDTENSQLVSHVAFEQVT